MKLAQPSNPKHVEQRLLAVHMRTRDVDELLVGSAWPWAYSEESGEYLVHISSAVLVQQSPLFRGYMDDECKSRVRDWLLESRRTFVGNERIVPTINYKWEKLFTGAWDKKVYQMAGMERVYLRLMEYVDGQIIADSTGLGKTIEAIGISERLRKEKKVDGPIVIVTMASLVSQWVDEIELFARSKPVVANVSGSRKRRLSEIAKAKASDYVATNYEIWRLPQYRKFVQPILESTPLVILDETSKVKNPEAKTTLAIRELCNAARWRLVFNATPIERCLIDFWVQLSLIDPNVMGSVDRTISRYAVLGENGRPVRYRNLKEFKQRSAMLYIRRTRAECGSEIPNPVAEERVVEMRLKQYAAYKRAVGGWVADHQRKGGVVNMARSAAVQRAALSPACYSDDEQSHESAKLDDFERLLDTELAGERVIVFTQYRRACEYIAQRLARFNPLQIHGKVSQADRNVARRRFSGRHGVGRLLVCTEAANYGLNLQASGVVVNFDLPWTHAKMKQRIGRVARIGQRRSVVLVINYVVTLPNGGKTIDHWKMNRLGSTRDLFRDVFKDDEGDELGVDTVDYDSLREYCAQAIKG